MVDKRKTVNPPLLSRVGAGHHIPGQASEPQSRNARTDLVKIEEFLGPHFRIDGNAGPWHVWTNTPFIEEYDLVPGAATTSGGGVILQFNEDGIINGVLYIDSFPTVKYQPDANFVGTETFRYDVIDSAYPERVLPIDFEIQVTPYPIELFAEDSSFVFTGGVTEVDYPLDSNLDDYTLVLGSLPENSFVMVTTEYGNTIEGVDNLLGNGTFPHIRKPFNVVGDLSTGTLELNIKGRVIVRNRDDGINLVLVDSDLNWLVSIIQNRQDSTDALRRAYININGAPQPEYIGSTALDLNKWYDFSVYLDTSVGTDYIVTITEVDTGNVFGTVSMPLNGSPNFFPRIRYLEWHSEDVNGQGVHQWTDISITQTLPVSAYSVLGGATPTEALTYRNISWTLDSVSGLPGALLLDSYNLASSFTTSGVVGTAYFTLYADKGQPFEVKVSKEVSIYNNLFLITAGEDLTVLYAGTLVTLQATVIGTQTGHTFEWEQLEGDTPTVETFVPNLGYTFIRPAGDTPTKWRFWVDRGTDYEQFDDLYVYHLPEAGFIVALGGYDATPTVEVPNLFPAVSSVSFSFNGATQNPDPVERASGNFFLWDFDVNWLHPTGEYNSHIINYDFEVGDSDRVTVYTEPTSIPPSSVGVVGNGPPTESFNTFNTGNPFATYTITTRYNLWGREYTSTSQHVSNIFPYADQTYIGAESPTESEVEISGPGALSYSSAINTTVRYSVEIYDARENAGGDNLFEVSVPNTLSYSSAINTTIRYSVEIYDARENAGGDNLFEVSVPNTLSYSPPITTYIRYGTITI